MTATMILDLEDEFNTIFLTDQAEFGRFATELAGKITETNEKLITANADICSQQTQLKDEFLSLSTDWGQSVQREKDGVMENLLENLDIVGRVEKKVQTVSRQLHKEVEGKIVHTKRLVAIENISGERHVECRDVKDTCKEIHARIQTVKKARKEVRKDIEREAKVLLEKTELGDKLEGVVEEKEAELAVLQRETSEKFLDASFGPDHEEIEALMAEVEWDFAKLETFLKDRDEFWRRIERLRNDVTGRERARQHKIAAEESAKLKRENDRLHALQFKLRKELISVERDLDVAAGRSEVKNALLNFF